MSLHRCFGTVCVLCDFFLEMGHIPHKPLNFGNDRPLFGTCGKIISSPRSISSFIDLIPSISSFFILINQIINYFFRFSLLSRSFFQILLASVISFLLKPKPFFNITSFVKDKISSILFLSRII